MSHSNAEKAAHAALHLMKEREVVAAVATAGGVALKAGAVLIAAPAVAPLAAVAAVGGLGYAAWKWLRS